MAVSLEVKKLNFSGEITKLLQNWCQGDEEALNKVISSVYNELSALARHHLKNSPMDLTLPPTALISEVYLRLVGKKGLAFQNRVLFFGFAGKLMRHILLDRARAGLAKKRGGLNAKVSLDENVLQLGGKPLDPSTMIDVEEALKKLEASDPRSGHIVEMRFFAGLTVKEIAEILHLSSATVKREWQLAKRRLAVELRAAKDADPKW